MVLVVLLIHWFKRHLSSFVTETAPRKYQLDPTPLVWALKFPLPNMCTLLEISNLSTFIAYTLIE